MDVAQRVLPIVDDASRPFWEAGRDGVLRFPGCNACGALLHPPVPVCRYCRSEDLATRDVARRFRFTAIQSPYGTRLAQTFGIDPNNPDTNAVVHGGTAWLKSDAALTVLSLLPRWGWVRVLFAIPKPLRDAVYRFVAARRRRWFGTLAACRVPSPAERARFVAQSLTVRASPPDPDRGETPSAPPAAHP